MESTEITNLREHFKALERGINLDDDSFYNAVIQYCTYIGRSRYISNLIIKVALDGEVRPNTLYTLWFWSYNMNSLRAFAKGEPGGGSSNILPFFFNKEIEQKFGLVKQFGVFHTMEMRRIAEAKRLNIDIEDVVLELSEEEKKVDKASSNQEVLFNLQALQNKLLASVTESISKVLKFDVETGILTIESHSVTFRKFTEQFHCLRILFSDTVKLKSEWIFSEIAENMDSEHERSDKQVYNYFHAIKRRIASESGIQDLFLMTTHSVRVNSDYQN